MSGENERLRKELEYWSKLISAHKKSLALQETRSEVSSSSEKPAAIDGCSSLKKQCSTNMSAAQTSVLPCLNSSVEDASGSHLRKISEDVAGVTANSARGGACVVLKGDSDNTDNATCSKVDLPCTIDVQTTVECEKVHCETSRQKNRFQVPDVSSALAAEMVTLYRSKILPKNSSHIPSLSSSCPLSATPASTASDRVENFMISRDKVGLEVLDSSMKQLDRTIAAKTPLVYKSPFRLVKAKTIRSPSCHGKSSLPQVSKTLQATVHSDMVGHNILGKMSQLSTVTSSVCHWNSRPFSTLANSVTKPSSCAMVSSLANSVHEKNANPKVNFTSSKYKLIRKREAGCRNASKRTSVTALKDTSVTALVPHQVVKHTPTLLVGNKYKLVQKKRSPLIASARRMPLNTKKMATSMKFSPGVLSPICRNSSASNSKTRSSRYKLVRKNEQTYSSLVKKPVTQLACNLTDDKVQVLSRYKLVRRKSTMTLRTVQRAAVADDSQHITHAHSLYNKQITPPLFLNKYKLIRKRALLKTSSTLRSPHYLTRSRKPSVEGNKHVHSRRRHTFPEAWSPNKKRGTRKQSFLSKYALRRSGKVCETELDINRILGRKVNNLSKNKYKFVSNSASSQRKSSRRTALPRKSQLKIDRRSSSARRASQNRRRLLPQTSSSVYKLRRKLGTITPSVNRRLSFKTSVPAGKSNLSLYGRTTPSFSLNRFSQRKFYWMRWSAADQRKKLAAESKNYCTYFNRFGRCSRGDSCKYIHDPDKVSVCTRFLRGTCKVTDCPFSHHVAPHKMPTCRYFLQGICNRDDCPYRHVNVAIDAEICLDFARGYCALADSGKIISDGDVVVQCKKKHLAVCPEFSETGSCPRGRRCPLRHTAKKRRRLHVQSPVKAENDAAGVLAKRPRPDSDGDDDDDIMLPLRQRRLPSFIAIDDTAPMPKPSNAGVKTNVSEDLVIRPRLAPLSTSHDLSWLLDP